jgi:hypothetical protein
VAVGGHIFKAHMNQLFAYRKYFPNGFRYSPHLYVEEEKKIGKALFVFDLF